VVHKAASFLPLMSTAFQKLTRCTPGSHHRHGHRTTPLWVRSTGGCSTYTQPLPRFTLDHFVNWAQEQGPIVGTELFLCDTALLVRRTRLGALQAGKVPLPALERVVRRSRERHNACRGFGVAFPVTEPTLCT